MKAPGKPKLWKRFFLVVECCEFQQKQRPVFIANAENQKIFILWLFL